MCFKLYLAPFWQLEEGMWRVEEAGLKEEDEGNPLVVGLVYHLCAIALESMSQRLFSPGRCCSDELQRQDGWCAWSCWARWRCSWCSSRCSSHWPESTSRQSYQPGWECLTWLMTRDTSPGYSWWENRCQQTGCNRREDCRPTCVIYVRDGRWEMMKGS